jgi:hypothetical protein
VFCPVTRNSSPSEGSEEPVISTTQKFVAANETDRSHRESYRWEIFFFVYTCLNGSLSRGFNQQPSVFTALRLSICQYFVIGRITILFGSFWLLQT